MKGRSIVTLVSVLLFPLLSAYAQDVVFVRNTEAQSAEGKRLEQVVAFFGLTIHSLDVSGARSKSSQIKRLRKLNVVAVIASADALPAMDRHLQQRLRRQKTKPIPLLIYGINREHDTSQLRIWSGNSIQKCTALTPSNQPKVLHISNDVTLAALSGLDLPAVSTPGCRLVLHPSPNSEVILSVDSSSDSSPVLLRTIGHDGDVYLVPSMQLTDRSWIGQPWGMAHAFSLLAPFLLFVHQSAGAYAWHLDGHYANFTIDDPWLTQPYGNLDYPGLLADMQKHNFHTTIAFVPWNYDRSDPQVAALFRDHPDRFSICIHGNNHSHREFGSYSDVPLSEQIIGIQQGLARMEQFQRSSGVKYDRVMVFPHGVAPNATFGFLRSFGLMATVNSLNVPLGTPFPTDPLFLLRPYTTAYSQLLSMSRLSVEVPVSKVDLAIHSFLGNPILLYAHQGLLNGGNDTFNTMADRVNHMAPDTKWTSLGNIARHMYLLRNRGDGGYDIRMLSNEISLTNSSELKAVYFIAVDSTSESGVPAWTIDGSTRTVTPLANTSVLRLELPPHQTRLIHLNSVTTVAPITQEIRHTGLRHFALRHLSDFRDMVLSRHRWGRAIIGFYDKNGGELIELRTEKRWYVPAGITIAGIVAIWYLVRRRKRLPFKQPTSIEV